MNTFVRPVAALALAAATASPVHAQTSVRVHGILDASVVSIHQPGPGSDRVLVHSGSLQTSRLGFVAREDLGGGLTAVADLLAGVGVDTGAGGSGNRFFNLGSSVGLSHRDWGTFDFGYLRNSNIFVAFATDLSGYGLANYAVTSQLQHNSIMTDGLGGFFENTLRYRTPTGGRWRAELTRSLGDETAGPGRSNNEFVAGNLQFTDGPLYVGVGYSDYATRTSARQDDARSTIIGATYDLKWVKLGGHAVVTRRPTVTQRGQQLSAKFKPLGDALELDLGWGSLSESTPAAPRSRAFTVGATYHLSKRTDVYAFAVQIANNEAGRRGLFFYGSGSVPAGGSSSAVGAGLRIAF